VEKPDINNYVKLNNKKFHYVIYGNKNKRTFLLIHGWSGSYENFRTWVPILAKKYRVVIPDLPGCNLSASLEGVHDLEAYSKFLKEFAMKLKMKNFCMGGICSGASIAMEYAKRYPEDVKLLFLHTPPISPGTIKPLFKFEAAIARIPMLNLFVRYIRKNEAITSFYKKLFIDGFDVNPEDDAVNMKNQKIANHDASVQLILDMTKKDYSDFLKALKIPIYVIITKNDALIDVKKVRKIVEKLPTVKLEVIEMGAHGWSDDFIERQNGILAKFFIN